jgi:hypothetical protein
MRAGQQWTILRKERRRGGKAGRGSEKYRDEKGSRGIGIRGTIRKGEARVVRVAALLR